jgi:TPP-dependent pyruvate/acetoin dehydrogenase alpha subunit
MAEPSPELRLRFYEQMVLIRSFEDRIRRLFAEGELFGTTHPCIGQEATAVGVVGALEPGDVVTSNHRGHGHFLAFTDDPDGLMAEIMGRATGVCGGRGGSQHVYAPNFYTNGITGGIQAVATGMAMAEKRNGTGRVVVAFLGEGAFGQGVVHEAMNFASLWDLPIIYAVENNLYAMSTHVRDALAGDLERRAAGFGIAHRRVEEQDVFEVHHTASQAVAAAREHSRPTVLEMMTYRHLGHSINDQRPYRTREEEAEWLARDPVAKLGAELDAADRERIERRCHDRIERALATARAAPLQDVGDLEVGLWQS